MKDQTAAGENDRRRAEREPAAEIVGAHQQRRAPLVRASEKGLQAVGRGEVQPRVGLVEKEQLGLVQKGTRKGAALQLAARERAHRPVRPTEKTHLLQEGSYPFADVVEPEQARIECEILGWTQVGVKEALVTDETDPPARRRAPLGGVEPEHLEPPRARTQKGRAEAKEGRLACSVRAQNSHRRAGVDAHTYAVERTGAAKALAQILCGNGRGHGAHL